MRLLSGLLIQKRDSWELVSDRVTGGRQQSVTGSIGLPFDTRSFFFYFRICPVPYTIFLIDVSASSPIGPLAWSFWVLIPISAP